MAKRDCRKCSKTIPTTLRIDGKTRSLQNRKFCLECSPYKGHNTSPNDPTGRRRKGPYKEYTDVQKDAIKVCSYYRGLKRRTELIELSGGKCSECGYNKCNRALSFHHIDQTTKLFGLTLNELWSRPLDIIMDEWKKCILLCSNCHMEEEHAKSNGKNIVAMVNAKYGTNF
jgi:hypothetical protein